MIRQTSAVWEPATAPFHEGECLVYATEVGPDGPNRFATWWHVIVLETEVCRVGASRLVIRCQQAKEDGAPRNGTDYKALTHLFREVHP